MSMFRHDGHGNPNRNTLNRDEHDTETRPQHMAQGDNDAAARATGHATVSGQQTNSSQSSNPVKDKIKGTRHELANALEGEITSLDEFRAATQRLERAAESHFTLHDERVQAERELRQEQCQLEVGRAELQAARARFEKDVQLQVEERVERELKERERQGLLEKTTALQNAIRSVTEKIDENIAEQEQLKQTVGSIQRSVACSDAVKQVQRDVTILLGQRQKLQTLASGQEEASKAIDEIRECVTATKTKMESASTSSSEAVDQLRSEMSLMKESFSTALKSHAGEPHDLEVKIKTESSNADTANEVSTAVSERLQSLVGTASATSNTVMQISQNIPASLSELGPALTGQKTKLEELAETQKSQAKAIDDVAEAVSKMRTEIGDVLADHNSRLNKLVKTPASTSEEVTTLQAEKGGVLEILNGLQSQQKKISETTGGLQSDMSRIQEALENGATRPVVDVKAITDSLAPVLAHHVNANVRSTIDGLVEKFQAQQTQLVQDVAGLNKKFEAQASAPDRGGRTARDNAQIEELRAELEQLKAEHARMKAALESGVPSNGAPPSYRDGPPQRRPDPRQLFSRPQVMPSSSTSTALTGYHGTAASNSMPDLHESRKRPPSATPIDRPQTKRPQQRQSAVQADSRASTNMQDAAAEGEDEASGAALVDEHTLVDVMRFYRTSSKTRHPLAELPDHVLAGLRPSLEMFKEKAKFETLDKPTRGTVCARARAVKKKCDVPTELETCSYCLSRRYACFVIESDRPPTLMPLPTGLRQGRTEDEPEYWIPG